MSFEVKRSVERVRIYGQSFTIRRKQVAESIRDGELASQKKDDLEAFRESLKMMAKLAVKDDTYKTDEEAQAAFHKALEDMDLEDYVALCQYIATLGAKKKELLAGP